MRLKKRMKTAGRIRLMKMTVDGDVPVGLLASESFASIEGLTRPWHHPAG